MRGSTARQTTMFAVSDPGDLIPEQHPIRRIRPFVDSALQRLEPTFAEMYARIGRPSIPPEQLLKASVLMALYSIRSERQFCERLQYDLLFKWFLGLNVEDAAFDPTSFSKNRERLLDHLVSRLFFQAVLEEARQRHLLSNQHFTVDGTLLESWASLKSLERKPNLGGQRKPKRGRRGGPKGPSGGGRNPEVNWHGERRSNETHVSKTDPEARLARKGDRQAAKLCYAGHVLMENRQGLVVEVEVTEANGRAEREAALKMLHRVRRNRRRGTVGADKGYDTKDFVQGCRELNLTPHVAQNIHSRRRSAVDDRTVAHLGYVVSQRLRKRVEEIFGWWKTVAGGRKLRYIGRRRNQQWAELTSAAFNLVRLANLTAAPA
jgi:transposase